MPRPTGQPTWLDFWTTDPAASIDFMTTLFPQWQVEDAGGASVAMLGDDGVCGFGPDLGGASMAAVYLATDDAAATADRAAELGATVLEHEGRRTIEAGPNGTFAIITDPQGVTFAVWQPGTKQGFGERGPVGMPGWFDLYTSDTDAAKAFYGALFDLEFTEVLPEFGGFCTAQKPGTEEGLFALGPTHGEDGWIASFRVESAEATQARAVEAGGTAVTGVGDMPGGHWAILQSPVGARFGIFDQVGDAS